MIRALYSLLMTALQPFLRRKLRRRGAAEPGYLDYVPERFGRYEKSSEPGRLWIHGVSLGETRAAAILVAQLRQERPGLRILLTHGTATGRAEGEKLLQPGDAQAWLPWDTPRGVRSFLKQYKPCMGVLLETELWPNLAAACRDKRVPLVLANARLSEKSLRRSLRLSMLSRPAFASLSAVWAQTEGDAQRLRQAGATVQGVFGNLKFDASPNPEQLAQGKAWRDVLGRPVLMFASSREGEEAVFLRAIHEHRARAIHLPQWLIVPRHPQRFDEVAALAAGQGFSVSRRSSWGAVPLPADIWIGDSLGEMSLYYGMADAALLGGSFEPLGGQNLIEAAACGCPVVMGPHTFNFAEAADLALAAGAAIRVPSLDEGVQAALGLLAEPARHRMAVVAAADFAGAHRGAAARTAAAVLALIGR